MSRRTTLVALAIAATAALGAPALAALKVGAKAPDFSAPAWLAGEPFTFELADALAEGPVVVYFFPAAHTPGCNVEAHLFSEAIGKFKEHDATVIGLTAGNTDELAAMKMPNSIGIAKLLTAEPPATAMGSMARNAVAEV